MKKSLKILVAAICIMTFSVSLTSCTSPDLAQEDELYDTQGHDWDMAGRG